MNEDFVSFSLAKKLKEKGYSQAEMNALAMYNEDGEWYSLSPTLDDFYYDFKDFDENDCVCPTISQVLKWLREEKKIFVEIVITPMGLYKPMIYDIGGFKKPYRDISPRIDFNEAALAGIEYVIENLI